MVGDSYGACDDGCRRRPSYEWRVIRLEQSMNCPGRPALCQAKHGWRDRSQAFMMVKLSARHRLHLVRLSFAFQVKLLLIPASSLMQSMIYFKLKLFIEGGA